MPQAISYIRFSSRKQIDSNSYERQQALVTRWLEHNPEYVLSDLSYEDLSRSGFKGEHIAEGGGWAKLLAAVEAGAIQAGDVVLVEAIDRTGRLPPLQMVAILAPILRAGATIVTLDDGISYTEESLNGGHLYLLAAKIQQAHQYSKALGQRITEGYKLRKEKAARGEGVKRITPVWLSSDGLLVPEVSVWIVKAFRWYIDGIGKAEIAKRLRLSGVKSLSRCSTPAVDSWLQHPTAKGYWNDIPSVYPPVVDNETWLLAQERRKAIARLPKTRTTPHFLTGLVKCASCGSNYTMHSKDGKPFSLRCVKHHLSKGSDCSNNSNIPKDVIDWVRWVTSTIPAVEALARQRVGESELELLELHAKIEEVSQQITTLVALAQRVGDVDEIISSMQSAMSERETLQKRRAVLERGNEPQVGLKALEWQKIESLYKHDAIRLNALLQSIEYAIKISPDKSLRVSWSGCETQLAGKYLGVKRAKNAVIGWKLQWGERVLVIDKGQDGKSELLRPLNELFIAGHLTSPNSEDFKKFLASPRMSRLLASWRMANRDTKHKPNFGSADQLSKLIPSKVKVKTRG